jgi:hypothetical protein
MGNPVYLIWLRVARRVWPVSRGCLHLRGTWSYHRICRRSVLPYTRFCNCLLITITFYTLLTSLFCIQSILIFWRRYVGSANQIALHGFWSNLVLTLQSLSRVFTRLSFIKFSLESESLGRTRLYIVVFLSIITSKVSLALKGILTS